MVYECPNCGREFDTRRGVAVHHVRRHDEHLPNRTCGSCGEAFYSEHEQRYCSDRCRSDAVSFKGDDNPNYSGRKETTTCDLCDAEFEYYPSEKAGKYCRECVESERWREPPTEEGEDHPAWSGGKTAFSCAVCGDDVERYPSNASGDVVVCSEDCRRTWLSETFAGTGHPNWQGGDGLNYGRGWSRIREAALERDGYECVVCSKSRAEIGHNPDVHHIVPVRQFIEADGRERADAHQLENVVSLCRPCHRKAEAGDITRERLRELIGES